MQNRDEDDDFFGISYISSTFTSYKEDIPLSTRDPSVVIAKRHDNLSSKQSDHSKSTEATQSGTEFLDDAFFPGINEQLSEQSSTGKKEVTNEDLRAGSDVFEEQYFYKNKSKINDSQGSRSLARENDDSVGSGSDSPSEGIQKKAKKQKEKYQVIYSSVLFFLYFFGFSSYFDRLDSDSNSRLQSTISELRSQYDKIWNMDRASLIEFLASNVLHNDGNVIAFNKPYGLAYSGGPANRPQFDRLLQQIKAAVAPRVERLYLVKSLDRSFSGVMLFSTSKLLQSELRDMVSNNMIKHTYRCLVRGELCDKGPVDVAIPLVKIVENSDMKLVPLLSNRTKHTVFHATTMLKTVNSIKDASLIEAVTTNEIPHQLRAHLKFAGCPLIGDIKYGGENGAPKLSNNVLARLNISQNHVKKLPMFVHHYQMNIPPFADTKVPLVVRAPVPAHFAWILKNLRLHKVFKR